MSVNKFENVQSGKFKRILDATFLTVGIYQLQIKLEDGTTINKRLIIQ